MSSPEQLAIVSTLEKHPEHVRAIGMISIEISNLDLELGGLLGGLLHVSRRLGQIIYLTPRTAIGRIQVVENVAQAVLQPKSDGLSRIEDLLARARSEVGRRHQMIHEAWGVHEDEDTPRRVALPKGDSKLAPIGELTSMIERIRILIFDIRAETNVVIESWPKTLPGRPPGLVPGESRLELPPGQKGRQQGLLSQLLSSLLSLLRIR